MSREVELQILTKMAATVGRNHRLLPPDEVTEVTGFMAMEGRLYNRELMVVGRAVNGWTRQTWSPESLASDKNVHEFVNLGLKSVTAPESCPMTWVSRSWGKHTFGWPSSWACVGRQDYNTRVSAFWRVIRMLVGKLGLANTENDTWPSHLVLV